MTTTNPEGNQMNEVKMCQCCHRSPATLRLTEPTDASAPKGTLYCDYCSTATCAGFERIESPAVAGCTVVVGADGRRCGSPAVASFTATDGETIYHECAEHCVELRGSGRRVGDLVTVHAYGREYVGQVVSVSASGAATAEFTTRNGNTKRARI